MTGLVRDGFEGKPMEGDEVTFTTEGGEKVASITTNESGEYHMTLKGGASYMVKVTKEGFKTTEEKINLPMGKGGDSYTLEKKFLLNK